MTTMSRAQIAGTLHGAEQLADQIAGSRVTAATFQNSPLMEQLVARIQEVRLIPHMSEPAYVDLMLRKRTIANRMNALMVFYGNSKAAEPVVVADVAETDGSEHLGKNCFYCGAPSPDKRADNMHGLFSRYIIDHADKGTHYCCSLCDYARGPQSLAKFEAWIERLRQHAERRRN